MLKFFYLVVPRQLQLVLHAQQVEVGDASAFRLQSSIDPAGKGGWKIDKM
jgi:hypothetical protein